MLFHINRNKEAFQYFYIARCPANLGLADTARFVLRCVLGPCLDKLLAGALFVLHATVVALRHRQIHRLIDGCCRFATRETVRDKWMGDGGFLKRWLLRFVSARVATVDDKMFKVKLDNSVRKEIQTLLAARSEGAVLPKLDGSQGKNG